MHINFRISIYCKFNSGYDQAGNKVAVKQVNEAGSDRGLSIELFLGDDVTQSQFVLNSGARVVIHNQSITPIIISEGVDIATGFQTNIGVRRSFLYKLDQPYSACIKNAHSADGYNSVYFKAIFSQLNMTTYRQKACVRLCLQAYVRAQCGCLDGSLPNLLDQAGQVCDRIAELNCVSQSRVLFFEQGQSCGQCPLECDSEHFQLGLSNSRYPTRYYQSYLTARTNILKRLPAGFSAEITKTTVLFTVFYEDLTTTYISETPAVTSISLLGNIGGNLGLFVGVSLLTFVEIIEIALSSLYVLWNRFKYRQNGN